MLQTGSSLGSGNAAVAKDAADETVAHAEDAAQQVYLKHHSTSNHLHSCVAVRACSAQLTAIFGSISTPSPPPLLAFYACTPEKLQQ